MIKPKCPHSMDYVPSAEYVQVYCPHRAPRPGLLFCSCHWLHCSPPPRPVISESSSSPCPMCPSPDTKGQTPDPVACPLRLSLTPDSYGWTYSQSTIRLACLHYCSQEAAPPSRTSSESLGLQNFCLPFKAFRILAHPSLCFPTEFFHTLCPFSSHTMPGYPSPFSFPLPTLPMHLDILTSTSYLKPSPRRFPVELVPADFLLV